ncbi:LysM peptidoglycan-binding domain-containing protein [Nocardioides coralli]|uniref:LysM peptidoglycan-binding domain-containing protein n=1 Tax=Nocardioides coralli TaxID=2872154 RepID=UPI001CA3D6FF|nr:Gmad2 immunoglobulin-like domain-containing protein [Nocardioides coralli]QZY29196.1 LysM peptidoglycan-binding domain-containing protein [Nocardioides coralli]
MGIITDVRVRQPRTNDVVGDRFVVAGIGAGFEGTIGIRVLGPRGRVLARDSAQSSAGGIGIGDFSTRVRVPDPPRAGTRLTVQVFGDNPGLPDEGPRPGFNTREVEVICFPKSRGFLLYRVQRGDTLTGIVRSVRDFTRVTVNQVVRANPRIEDPDLIHVGWRLRIPIQG